MINSILVPVDRSDTSDRMSDWAAKFAARIGAKIKLLAVIDPNWLSVLEPIGNGRRFDTGVGSGLVTAAGTTVGASRTVRTESHTDVEPGFGGAAIDQAVQTAKGYLTARSKTMAATGVDVTLEVLIGDPATEIRVAAAESGAGLIVMATHRESPLSRGVMGSVTDRIVRTSGVPVMAVHPATLELLEKTEKGIESVIVPLDGSKGSELAVPVASDIARSAGAKLVLLSAYGSGFLGFFGSHAKANLNRVAFTDYLERIDREMVPGNVVTTVEVAEGDADDVIQRAATTHNNSIIVLSSHGSSGLKRMVLGSVADKVIRTTEHPVVVVSENRPAEAI